MSRNAEKNLKLKKGKDVKWYYKFIRRLLTEGNGHTREKY